MTASALKGDATRGFSAKKMTKVDSVFEPGTFTIEF